jgi:hypothetical protein
LSHRETLLGQAEQHIENVSLSPSSIVPFAGTNSAG